MLPSRSAFASSGSSSDVVSMDDKLLQFEDDQLEATYRSRLRQEVALVGFVTSLVASVANPSVTCILLFRTLFQLEHASISTLLFQAPRCAFVIAFTALHTRPLLWARDTAVEWCFVVHSIWLLSPWLLPMMPIDCQAAHSAVLDIISTAVTPPLLFPLTFSSTAVLHTVSNGVALLSFVLHGGWSSRLATCAAAAANSVSSPTSTAASAAVSSGISRPAVACAEILQRLEWIAAGPARGFAWLGLLPTPPSGSQAASWVIGSVLLLGVVLPLSAAYMAERSSRMQFVRSLGRQSAPLRSSGLSQAVLLDRVLTSTWPMVTAMLWAVLIAMASTPSTLQL